MEVVFITSNAEVGTESMIRLAQFLQSFRKNKVINKETNDEESKRILTESEQLDVVDDILDHGLNTMYIKPVNWIDFSSFELEKPIYINLVKDPVERVISWYYHERTTYLDLLTFPKNAKLESWYKKKFNDCVRNGDPECQYVPYTITDTYNNNKRQSLVFCGHHVDCLPFDSPMAIQIAKTRVETEYAVVGTWEEPNITLAVLEAYIPKFFKGATMLYNINKKEIDSQTVNRRMPTVDENIKEMIRKNFTHEYEFYYFCKQRLYKQYIATKLKYLLKVNVSN